jgi:hypothetical protein
MGELPKNRINLSERFTNTGIEYCSPFYINGKRYCNHLKFKVYIAIFIYFTLKVVHLEVVSDLTTKGYTSSLRRFFSRRVKYHNIYSDNVTNFIGANNELKKLNHLFKMDELNNNVENYL